MGNCPKCGCERSADSESCPKCGVIFSKIRDTSHEGLTYGKSEAVPSREAMPARKTKPLSRTAKRNLLIAVILILGTVFQLFKLRSEKEVANKPRTMISEDGYSRITIGTDSNGNEMKTIEPLRKPMNEAERLAIRKRNERARDAASEREAAELARREEKARVRQRAEQ